MNMLHSQNKTKTHLRTWTLIRSWIKAMSLTHRERAQGLGFSNTDHESGFTQIRSSFMNLFIKNSDFDTWHDTSFIWFLNQILMGMIHIMTWHYTRVKKIIILFLTNIWKRNRSGLTTVLCKTLHYYLFLICPKLCQECFIHSTVRTHTHTHTRTFTWSLPGGLTVLLVWVMASEDQMQSAFISLSLSLMQPGVDESQASGGKTNIALCATLKTHPSMWISFPLCSVRAGLDAFKNHTNLVLVKVRARGVVQAK